MGVPVVLSRIFRPGRLVEKIAYFAILSIIILALIFSYSRSAWFALAASLFVFAAIVFFKHSLFISSKSLKAAAFVLLMIVLVPTAVKFVPALNPSSISVARRINSTRNFLDEQGYVKLALWGVAFEMMKDKPLFGVGLGNYGTYHPMYRTRLDPKYFYGGMTYDVYNDYLELGAEAGFPALFLYLTILVVFLYHAVRFAWNPESDKHTRWLAVGLISSCIAFIAHCTFFQFPMKNLPQFSTLWLFMALMFVLIKNAKTETREPGGVQSSQPVPDSRRTLPARIVFSVLFACVFCLSAIHFNRLLNCTFLYGQVAVKHEYADSSEVIELCEKQINSCPHYKNEKIFPYLGQLLISNARCKKAQTILEESTRHYPFNYYILKELKNAYLCLGDRESAMRTNRKLVEYFSSPSSD